MIRSISRRIILSGTMAEVYEYETPVLRGLTDYARKKSEAAEYANEGDNEGGAQGVSKVSPGPRSAISLARSRKSINRLIHLNFYGQDTRFLTLTFADEVRDIKKANRLLKNGINRIRRAFPGAFGDYIAIPELHTGYDKETGEVYPHYGCIHYHLCVNGRYIPKCNLEQAWGHGFVKISRVFSPFRIGYLVKYLNKANSWVDSHSHLFLCSTGLKRPVEFINPHASWDDVLLENMALVHENKYISDYDMVTVTKKTYEIKIPEQVLLHMTRVINKRRNKKVQEVKNEGLCNGGDTWSGVQRNEWRDGEVNSPNVVYGYGIGAFARG